MIKTASRFLGIAILLIFLSAVWVSACTSFMMETERGLYFVHSLNQGNVPAVPGLVCINQRDTWKKGYGWSALIDVKGESSPELVWKSEFGSVTFNPFGVDFPDGGMNEAGLFIWEMSFDTEYPSDTNKPTLFQAQWMQYVLDNFSRVEEVIENAGRMSIDGWGWHYFVADKSGATAIIDFVGGNPVVYAGESMPVPICCNSVYPEAIEWLSQHTGFGGELEIEKGHEEIPRFIYGAKLMKDYSSQDPVDYSFWMLDEMSKNVRWSVVFDVERSRVYFKTNLNRDVRWFEFTPDDFGRSDGPLLLNIECRGPGDVRNEFLSFNPETNRMALVDVFGLMCDMDDDFRKMLLEDQGTDLEGLAGGFAEKIEWTERLENLEIAGTWTGTVNYPTPDSSEDYPFTLVLSGETDNLSGTASDGGLIEDVPISNAVYKGGLFRFTVKIPDSEKVLHFQLFSSLNKIRGAIKFIDGKRSGSVSLVRESG